MKSFDRRQPRNRVPGTRTAHRLNYVEARRHVDFELGESRPSQGGFQTLEIGRAMATPYELCSHPDLLL